MYIHINCRKCFVKYCWMKRTEIYTHLFFVHPSIRLQNEMSSFSVTTSPFIATEILRKVEKDFAADFPELYSKISMWMIC